MCVLFLVFFFFSGGGGGGGEGDGLVTKEMTFDQGIL